MRPLSLGITLPLWIKGTKTSVLAPEVGGWGSWAQRTGRPVWGHLSVLLESFIAERGASGTHSLTPSPEKSWLCPLQTPAPAPPPGLGTTQSPPWPLPPRTSSSSAPGAVAPTLLRLCALFLPLHLFHGPASGTLLSSCQHLGGSRGHDRYPPAVPQSPGQRPSPPPRKLSPLPQWRPPSSCRREARPDVPVKPPHVSQ